MANTKQSDFPDGGPILGNEIQGAVQDGNNVKYSLSTLRDYFSEPVTGTAIFCGNMDLSADVVPTTGGTGTSGAIKKGNFFYINIGSSVLLGPDGGPVLSGYFAFAKIDTPGGSLADKTKWILIPTIV